jgi:hypothetical protein
MKNYVIKKTKIMIYEILKAKIIVRAQTDYNKSQTAHKGSLSP